MFWLLLCLLLFVLDVGCVFGLLLYLSFVCSCVLRLLCLLLSCNCLFWVIAVVCVGYLLLFFWLLLC